MSTRVAFTMRIFIMFCMLLAEAQSQERNLLTGPFTLEKVRASFLTAKEWHPFPRYTERDAWSRIPEQVKSGHIAAAEKYLHGSWPLPKATDFLEYVRNGNRSRYQAISFGRREQLASLVLGECLEGKGRFLDDIANGVWTICEETYWGVPAHVGAQKRGPGLPDVTEPTVDLFAAETGMLLAWTYYLVGDELNSISPLVADRIKVEVRRRIIDPNLERDDFWWMGFNRTVNNWNPWICSNWLTAVLILEEDPSRRAQSVHKIMRCLDNFLNPYPADGGCDEGPSYWGRAGGSLFDCLELLQSASNGAVNLFKTPLVRDIGRYIYKVYIHDEYFTNFADAPARHEADASLIYRYGKCIDDGTMKRFGAYLARLQGLGENELKGRFGSLGRVLPALFTIDELLRTEPAEPLIRDFWLPELQVMGARSARGSTEGFFLAAQGGHNDESHNHNDVGNFVIYADGEPVIIDVGVETYTAKTFSKDRYSIWTMQSAYHNLPTVNGVMQKEGRQHEGSDVRYSNWSDSVQFSLDISAAYPPEAGMKRWLRSLLLDRVSNVVELSDEYQLDAPAGELTLSFMTSCDVSEPGPGMLVLARQAKQGAEAPSRVVMRYDPDKLSPRVETIELTDDQLQRSWGKTIRRIMLVSKSHQREGAFKVSFSK